MWRPIALALALTCGFAVPAQASDDLGAARALADVPVRGANDWSCRPSPAHPRPVVLVHGTFATPDLNWIKLAPLLKEEGYCVFAPTYGRLRRLPLVAAVGPIDRSAEQLATFVDGVLEATGADRVDLVGHSQGGMMPRWYLRFLGGAQKVRRFVAWAPSNHGTTLSGLVPLAKLVPGATAIVRGICPACADQMAGSAFLETLNAGHETEPGVEYTVFASDHDSTVTPVESAFLAGQNVRNVMLHDGPDHALMAVDPDVLRRTVAVLAVDPDTV
ncbi:esterase/lipase family protein [Nonomuraea sp. NPDC050556]|uniref:esterase/lipase family protein n=1 Tax=Nonomuraea sp. NPDC050556 TaxID=3364369 RepID=UPI0037B63D68